HRAAVVFAALLAGVLGVGGTLTVHGIVREREHAEHAEHERGLAERECAGAEDLVKFLRFALEQRQAQYPADLATEQESDWAKALGEIDSELDRRGARTDPGPEQRQVPGRARGHHRDGQWRGGAAVHLPRVCAE